MGMGESMISGGNSVFEAIMELNEKVSTIKNDLDWLKDSVKSIRAHQTACAACSNAKYLTDQADKNREDIKKLQDDRNMMYGIAIAIPTLISIAAFLIEQWR